MFVNQQVLTAKELHEWLVKHKVVANLPPVLTRLDALLRDPRVSVEQISALLAADVTISANIMKAVGAMRYVTVGPAESLTDAVSRLGFGDVRVIAYAAVFVSRIAPTPNIPQKTFWMSDFVSAVAARELASHLTRVGLGKFDPSTAFLLGLAHDIGMLVLDAYAPKTYKEVIAHSYFNPSALSRHEKDALGVNHGVAGAVLMKVWGLPEAWIMAVAGHSFPARLPKEFQPWADLLLAAESMAFYLGYHNGVCQAQKPEVVPELVVQRLHHMHFDPSECCQLGDRIRKLVDQEGWAKLVDDLPT